MNAKLMRNLVDRYAPEETREVLRELDKLAETRRELAKQIHAKEFEILTGKKLASKAICEACGQDVYLPSLPSLPERNGHVMELADR